VLPIDDWKLDQPTIDGAAHVTGAGRNDRSHERLARSQLHRGHPAHDDRHRGLAPGVTAPRERQPASRHDRRPRAEWSAKKPRNCGA
jgi:hypothetical protein